MKIGAALVLIAVGAILRFALTTVVTHGVYLHTVGDILMGVGVLGLILWAVIWAPWTRNRGTSYQRTTRTDYPQNQPAAYPQTQQRTYEERTYEDQTPL
jgi:hypothetical protein